MRVAQLIDGLFVGGAERLLVTFAESAVSRQMSPSVIALRIYPGTPYVEQLHAIQTPVVEFRGRNLIDPIRFLRLVNYLRHENFDILHVHLTYAIILGGLAGKLIGLPVVASIHNIKPDRWEGLESFALRNWVSAVVAVGHEVAKSYRPRLGNKKLDVVVNAVAPSIQLDLKNRLAVRTDLGVSPNETLILAVGRLAPQKGYDDLLSAMQELIKMHGDVKLVIAGIGDLHEHLTSKIVELDLQSSVSLLGSRNDVLHLMAASDIFVNSSLWEGLPIAILEAMSAGLPVVATAVGDVPYIISSNLGILVEPHEPTQLARALNQLCKDAVLRIRLGAHARTYISQHHSADAWVKQLAVLYSRVLKDD